MKNFDPLHSALITALLLLASASTARAQTRWVGSWACSQQLVEPQDSLPKEQLRGSTLWQIVHLTLGGTQIRVRLSNRFGDAPLHFTSVHVARASAPGSPRIAPESDKPLTFSGASDIIVPAGADYISDPLEFSVAPLSDLAISLRVEQPPALQTGHPGSRTTSFLADGDMVAAADLPNAKKVEHWYFISGVDVPAPSDAAAIVALGDSITDGHGVTTDANNRWTDVLAQRLQASPETRHLSVLNEGIGGNRVLLDGIGPNALARFDRDVLAQPGVRFLIVLEGVNDIGMLSHGGEGTSAEHDLFVHRMISAYAQMITRAHTHGLKVIGGTIAPFSGFAFYHPGPASEADRQAVNAWIRTPGHFDAVIDFDTVMRDPEHPDRMLEQYDSGDHLHPSVAGYAAMGNAVPLALFSSATTQAAPQLAFTFDDLPSHGPLPPGKTRLDVITKIISALQNAGAPPTYGFVNGSPTQSDPGNIAVLQAWRVAGYPLGNHTWSHMNLNQHTLTGFEDEINRNEPLLASLMKNEDWHWFRFPFLAEGDTPEKRSGVRAFLAQRGYKIAGVTMGFGDYLWNEPYARCKAKGDNEAIAQLKISYLKAAADAATYDRELSRRIYGRDIPYVLLMHVGALDAEMLPALLDQYRAEGFQFITLQQAETDDFYRNNIDLNLPVSADSLEQVAAQRGITLPPHAPPNISFDTLCR